MLRRAVEMSREIPRNWLFFQQLHIFLHRLQLPENRGDESPQFR